MVKARRSDEAGKDAVGNTIIPSRQEWIWNFSVSLHFTVISLSLPSCPLGHSVGEVEAESRWLFGIF